MTVLYLLATLSALATALAQLFLKLGSLSSRGRSALHAYLNLWSAAGYGLFFSVTLLNTFIYKTLPLSMSVLFVPLIYIFVAIFSIFLLRERPTRRQMFGMATIIAGIAIYALGLL